MPATAPTRVDEVTSQDVELFCNFCVSLRSAFRHFQILFDEGGDLRRELLWTTSPTFFGDLNLALIEHIILQICKIMDPEESFGRLVQAPAELRCCGVMLYHPAVPSGGIQK